MPLIEILALFCSLFGVALAVLSFVVTRRGAAEKASRECHEQLLEEQRVTERLSKQLQELRLKYGEADE